MDNKMTEENTEQELSVEASRLCAEAYRLWQASDRLRADAYDLRVKGDHLWKEGDRLWHIIISQVEARRNAGERNDSHITQDQGQPFFEGEAMGKEQDSE